MGSALPNEDDTCVKYLQICLKNIEYAEFCAKFLIKKGWHSPSSKRRGTVYQQQMAFVMAMIISYCRPFTPGKSWLPGKYGTRLGDVIDTILHVFSDSEKRLHEQILELRNQLVAHSEGTRFDIDFIFIDGKPIPLVNDVPWFISADVTASIIGMISKLREAIHEKIESIMATRPADAQP